MFVALYGLTVYLVFLASFAYALGWVVNLPWLPKTIDSGTPRSEEHTSELQSH